MHSRLTILSRFFSATDSFSDELDLLAACGVQRAGLRAQRLQEAGSDKARAAVEASGIAVTHLGLGAMLPLGEPSRFEEALERARQAVDAAVSVGAPSIYGPTGGAPALDWDDAATAFVAGIAPAAEYARSHGISVLLEPTVPMFSDISILTTLRDTTELAQRAGIGVCLDVQHCWRERGLREAIRRAVPNSELVQISDWVPGRRDYVRAPPGDGAVPLERILGWILDDGYAGIIDLEVTLDGDTPPAETIERALDGGGRLLERFGL